MTIEAAPIAVDPSGDLYVIFLLHCIWQLLTDHLLTNTNYAFVALVLMGHGRPFRLLLEHHLNSFKSLHQPR